MKRNVKRVTGCMAVFILLVIAIWYLGRLTRPVTVDSMINTINTFHSLPEDSVEVIAYGSSIVWYGLNVVEMYKEYGIGAYNYSCSWQKLNTTEQFFLDSLRTQSPKVVLIETHNVNDLAIDIGVVNDVYCTRWLGESPEKWRYLQQCFGRDIESWAGYYIPLCVSHDNWNNIGASSFNIDAVNDATCYKTMGWQPVNDVEPVVVGDLETFEQWELDKRVIVILDNIVRICTENDIEIIFYTAPFAGAYSYCSAMEKYAIENRCSYINFFDMIEETGIDGNTDFFDALHLNMSGATKVADYLGEYIVNNYDVTDFRQYVGNIWQQKLE